MVKEVGGSSRSPNLCRLYFKGLVGEDSSAGFGFAICGQNNDLLFQMKGPIHGSNITVLEAELTALKQGLIEAIGLRINHISIYCDRYPIYKLVMGRSLPEENKTALLMKDVQCIRGKFESSFPIFVAENSIKYAYKLAKETIVSEIRIQVEPPLEAKPRKKKTCSICLDDDINADQMFSVGNCRHKFCSECVKRHIEVRLLERSLMRCPRYRCNSKLNFGRCVNLLTPKLREMWVQRIKEDLIPFADRVYCPNPKCSVLMSKTEVSKEAEMRRCCFKCGEPFCPDCKVMWHMNLSCNDYKKLHPNSTSNDEKLKTLANQKRWRQCGKCQHMIERSQGCANIICRCGHKFCYRCGAEAGGCYHAYGLPLRTQQLQLPPPTSLLCAMFWFLGGTLASLFFITLIYLFAAHLE